MTQTAEREDLIDITRKYPRKWIVMTNVVQNVTRIVRYNGKKKYCVDYDGIFYGAYDTKQEAVDVEYGLEIEYGMVRVIEGYDDRPSLGGFFLE